jgi:Bifunctional DNA primase/polymerase, N-terminal/Protein of unknown function (DUF3987)
VTFASGPLWDSFGGHVTSPRTLSRQRTSVKTTASVLQQARKYLERGWQVVPVPCREKGPHLKEWQKLRLDEEDLPEYFDKKANIGILLGEPSRGLVDVDLDCAEARQLAPLFLSKTGRIHGRKTSPASHYWFYINDSSSPEKYADIDGTCLLELRSTGQQTIVPPSVHPSGERLHWEKKEGPAKVSRDELKLTLAKLAGASLLARHWPVKGSRNHAALALAGVLLHAEWEEEEVKTFIRLVAMAADDEEWKDRGAVAACTRKRIDRGKETTGRTRLNDLLGERVVEKALDWLGIKRELGATESKQNSRKNKWPKPLEEAAYYGLAGEIVRAIEEETEADPAALLLHLLAAFGNCVGGQPYFEIEGAKQRSILFCLIVGRSAKARKGTAWSHIKRLFSNVDPDWLTKCLASNLSSGEGVVWAVRNDQSAKRNGRSRRAKKGTEEPAEKRLFVIQTEFASALRVQRRDGNTLSAILRQAWDSDRMRILTKTLPTETTGAHVSIVGHITEEELRRELTETDQANGYANRFLFVCAERKRLLPLGGRIDSHVLRPLVLRLQLTKFRASKIGEMQLSQNATRLWCKYYKKLSNEIPGMLGYVTARSEAQVLRIAMIYALFDYSAIMKTRHLRAAYAVWKYCSRSARYIFGGSLGNKDTDIILRALKDSKKGLTRDEIRELFSRNSSSSRIQRALDFLLEHRLAKHKTKKTNGRPAEIWKAI